MILISRRLLILISLIITFPFIGYTQCNVDAGANVSVCRFLSTNLNAIAGGGANPYSYLWTPAAGLSSTTISNPIATPNATTNYTVTITDSLGCTASDFVVVTVNPLPTANAGPNISVCPGQSSAIGGSPTANGGTPPYSYTWSPAAGLSSTIIANPLAGPAVVTNYTVVVSDFNGCSRSDNVVVNLFASPIAAFSFNPNNQCSGTPVLFTNSSIGAGLTYSWDFGDPTSASNTSSLQNPSHIFIANGCGSQNYTVTLTVTDVNGCTATATQVVTALLKPDPILTDVDIISPFSNCDNNPSPSSPNFSITLNNSTLNTGCITNYSIDWGDGNISNGLTGASFPITHNYTQLGAFNLIFTALGSNGCQGTTTYVVANQSNPAVGITSLGGTSGCAPQTFQFIVSGYLNNSPGTFYVIDFGDGTAPVTISHASLLANDTIVHTYTTSSCGSGLPGNQFTVTATAFNACSSTPASVGAIKVYINPIAQFTPNPLTGCTNVNECFTNQTLPGYGFNCTTVTGYLWDFGDGFTSTATSPCHIYTNPGSYIVTLSATNLCGTTSFTDTVCINAPPLSSFTLNTNTGCAPLAIQTTNTSSTLSTCGNSNYTWSVTYVSSVCNPTPGSWSYTGGTNQNSINPSFIFNNPGTYTITLAVQNACSTVLSSQNIIVKTVPAVTLNAVANFCGSGTVNPSATFNSCYGTISAYNWNFPGGIPANSNLQVPGAINYPASGAYTISLSATNECGTTNASTNFTIYPLPIANAGNPQMICQGTSVTLGGAPTASGGNAPYTYSWSSTPAGFSSTLANPTATPAVTTTYTVLVTDTRGCTASSSVVVTVNPRPTVSVNSVAICNGSSATLIATVSGGTLPYTYLWSNGGNTSIITISPGATTTYTVTVTDSSPTNCSSTASGTVTVNPIPNVTANSPTICLGSSVNLTATGSGGTAPYTYLWSTGGITQTISVSPGATTTYTVTVTDNSATHCTNSTIAVVTVNPLPVVTVVGDTICQGTSTTLTATVSGATPPYTYLWNTGPVTPSITVTPAVTTSYTVTVSDGTSTHCTSRAIVTVFVNPRPTVTITNQAVCLGNSATLTANPVGGTLPYTYLWNTGGTLQTMTASPVLTTTYTVTVTESSISNCTNTATGTITIYPLPVVNAGLDQTLCNQMIPYTLTGYSPIGGTWSGVGVTPGGVFTPGIPGLGSTALVYSYTNGNGCTNRDTVIMNVISPIFANAGNDTTVCMNSLQFQCIGTPAGGSWSGSALVTPGGIFVPSASGTYNITYTYGTGTCLTSDIKTITVTALPIVAAGVNQSFCIDTPPFNLAGASPAGGNWTGTGITNGALGTFDPTVSGAGTFILTYTYTDIVTSCSNSATKIITVYPLPVVDAGTNQTLCNQMIPYTLTGYSPVGGTWSGVGVTPGGVFTPGTAGLGITTLTYTFTNVNGCTNSDTVVMNVVSPIFANAGSDTSVCINSVQFQCIGTPAGGTWSGSALITPGGIFVPSASGTYTVTYSYGSGTCLTSDTKNITVNPLPVVNAGTSQSMCINIPPFNLAGATPVGGIWSGTGITNGALGTFNPSVAGPGTFILTYTYTAPLTGCINSATKFITVYPLPLVEAGTNQMLCNQMIPYTITGYSPLGGTWSGTGVTPAGVFTPGIPGVGNTTLTYSFTDGNGCINSDSIIMTVINPANANAGADTAVCINSGQFQCIGLPALGSWSGSALVTPGGIFVPSASGTYTLTYTYGTGTCLTTDTKDIIVQPLPVVNAGMNQSLCLNIPPFNLAGATPVGGIWTGTGITNGALGTFNPSVAGTGTFVLTYHYMDPVTSCVDSSSKSITINPMPVASFTHDSLVCVNSSVTFLNSSTGAASYQWNFGDGNISAGVNPPNTYISSGFYNVTLVATTTFGCTDTAISVIHAMDPPVSSFSLAPPSGCGPLLVNFTNTSTGLYSTYSWNFGNGQSSNLQNPAPVSYSMVLYTDTTYYPILSVTNMCGTSSSMDSVRITYPPHADFGTNISSGCSIVTVIFSNITTGLPQSFYWDFGDGTTDSTSQINFTHDYATGQNDTTYYITMIAYNVCGNDTITHSLLVQPNPINAFFNANPLNGCAPLVVNFVNYSTGNGITNNNFWSFGDGNISSQVSPSHIYTTPGTYTVSLAINNTCSYDTAYATITVFPFPVVNFNLNPAIVCVGQPISINNTSLNITNTDWDFGNGDTSPLFAPAYVYNTPGTYVITLVGTSFDGCIDSLSRTITVLSLPIVNAGPNNIFCISNNPTQLTGFSPLGGSWSGPGVSAGGVFSPATVGAGTFTLVYSYTGPNNCTNSDSIQVDVIIDPIADAGFDTSVCISTTQVQLTGNPAGGTWSGLFISPSGLFTVPAPGNYPLVYSYGPSNCVAHDTVIITVSPLPVVNAGIDQSVCLDATPFFLTGLPNGGLWSGDGIMNAAQGLFNPSVAGMGTHVLYYTFTDPVTHCQNIDSLNLTVTPLPVLTINPSAIIGCQPLTVYFLNTSLYATNYMWYFGDGDSSTAVSPTHVYQQSGNYTVTVYANSVLGCSASATLNITVYPAPLADVGIDSVEGCVPFTFTFPNVSILGSEFYWDFGDGDTSTQYFPTHTYQSPGVYTVNLTVTSTNGCVDVETNPGLVTVHPQPIADFYPNPYITTIAEAAIEFVDLSVGANTWNWYFGDGGTSDQQSPFHNFPDTGIYIIYQYVSNEWGCMDSASATVRINDFFTFYAPNAFSPNGDGINDVFLFKGTGIDPDKFSLDIFDRWGKRLFHNSDIEEGWNGMDQRSKKVQPQGVYTYLVVVTDNNNISHKFVGSVTLLQ
jgi:large repetitive protein